MISSSIIASGWESSNLDNPFVLVQYYGENGNLIKTNHFSPYLQKIDSQTKKNRNFIDYSFLFKTLPTFKPQVFIYKTGNEFTEHHTLYANVHYRMHKKDVVHLAMYRTHSTLMQELIKLEKAKKNSAADQNIDKCILKRDYSSALKMIWANQKKSLKWLRKNQIHLPPIFLFELGISEFQHVPTIETIKQVVFPLFRAATFRIYFDGCCLKSGQEGEVFASRVGQILHDIYTRCLYQNAERHLDSETKKTDLAFLNSDEIRQLAMPYSIKKIVEMASDIIGRADEIASPHWLVYHTGKFINAQAENVGIETIEPMVLQPQDSWKPLRINVVKEVIQKISIALPHYFEALGAV